MGKHDYTPEQQAFYKRHINSPVWKAIRSRRIAKAGGVCEYQYVDLLNNPIRRCTATKYLTVHHRHYRNLGNERDDDLEVLCYVHHMVEHVMRERCEWCTEYVFGCIEECEEFIRAELIGLGIDLEQGRVRWDDLPHPEAFGLVAPDLCVSCRNRKKES